MTTTKTAEMTCPKCLGSGNLPRYSHIDNGRCFVCAGSGVAEVSGRDRSLPRRSDAERIESMRLEFRAVYRNIRSGMISAVESWEGRVSPDGCGWTPSAVAETLAEIGATEAFRRLGWPV